MSVAPWQLEIWNRVVARAAKGTLPHALLLTGPPGAGKRAFAERLAAFLLCDNRDDAPCGRCRSCQLYAVRAQRDPEETRPGGSLAQPDGYPGHPDARFVGFAFNDKSKKMYGEVVVDQIRELSAWLALTPQIGRAQVVLIEPADAMNNAAANALLKTLEEPNAARYLLLVSAHPARLPATIRSRCQHIGFSLPPGDTALGWLLEHGIDRPAAEAALEASAGNPGLALIWAREGRAALRDEVAAHLRVLQQGKGNAAEIAGIWARNDSDMRLWFATMLVQAEAAASASRVRGPLALTGDADLTKLAAWFDRANRARDLLRGPLRAELVLLELLVEWKAAAAPRRSRVA
ncbi:MAG TPA: DNA polymerase III subunit delta' [Rudaea sp.]|jgi:DNA polymerase-3 subunit delta'